MLNFIQHDDLAWSLIANPATPSPSLIAFASREPGVVPIHSLAETPSIPSSAHTASWRLGERPSDEPETAHRVPGAKLQPLI